MKKLLLTIAAFLCFASSLWASEPSGDIVVHFRDGSYRVYLFSDLRCVDIDGADVVVEWGEDKADRYARTQVARINFKGDTTTASVAEIDDTVVVKVTDGLLMVNGLQSSAEAYIFDLSGALMMSSRRVANGEAIDISHLDTGVYVVELSNGQSFKFMKR